MKIISGGQTGVDRAALDVAARLGFARGGWCPRGRLAEDGRIPEEYPLRETRSALYAERTRRNVLDADATLILNRGPLSGGTALTVRLAQEAKKRLWVVDLDDEPDPPVVRAWIQEQAVGVLNVAGPRESGAVGIYARSVSFLCRLFKF